MSLSIQSNPDGSAEILRNGISVLKFNADNLIDFKQTPVFKRDNVLGVVSQSGGVPTGAVIESGSNANGEYVKFADGTQICTNVIGVTDAGYITWTFPALFKTNIGLSIVGSSRASSTATLVVAKVHTVVTGSCIVGGAVSTGGYYNGTLSFIAIGRWY